jgi:hypothetical protein
MRRIIHFPLVCGVILALAGMLSSTMAHAQSLAEILTAIQKRKQLVEERKNVSGKLGLELANRVLAAYNAFPDDLSKKDVVPWPSDISDQEKTDAQSLENETPDLINWQGVSTHWPTDADIAKVGIDGQIKLINQAWDELDQLDSEYWDSQSIEDGVGRLKAIQISKLPIGISINESRFVMQKLAARVRNFRLVKDWPILMQGADNVSDWQEYWVQSSWADLSGDGSYAAISPLYYAISRDDYGIYSVYYHWIPYSAKSAASSADGQIQQYTNFSYFVTDMSGLGSVPDLPNDTYGDAGNLLWVSQDATANISQLDVSLAPFNGTWAGIPYNGKWVDKGSFNSDGLWQSQWVYEVQFPHQSSSSFLPDDFIGLDYPTANTESISTLNATTGLGMQTAFLANFGQEFAGKTNAPPEVLPALRIEPRLEDGELVVRLANTPANECELVWKFPRAITTGNGDNDYGTGALADHNVLTVRGCGAWDAVYSGGLGDREQELQWSGDYKSSYKRWKNFEDYDIEYWQAVLVQVKSQTYAVNIKQLSEARYKYQVDFYRQDQFGESKVSGRYGISGSPIASYTVENPESDPDSNPGSLKISTSDGAIYLLTLMQSKSTVNNITYADSRWILSLTQNSTELLHKDVSVTQQRYSWIRDYNLYQNGGYWQISKSQPKKVVDQTSINGVALPQVTTTYWDFDWQLANIGGNWDYDWQMLGVASSGHSTRQYIDKVVEVSSDGTRTTSYTYSWDTKDKTDRHRDMVVYDHINYLTQIQQSGGPNPYTANYDSAGQLTSYSDTWGSENVTYSGNTVTRTEKINGQPVRTLVTTYSGDMSKATTTAQ